MNKRFFCLLLAGTLAFGSGLNALATSISQVQKEQTQTKNKLNEVNESITAIENKRREVQSQLNNLNADLVETILTLELLEADLETKQEEISEAQAEYDRLAKLEEEQYESMKLRIQYMYEKGNTDYITMLLRAESISDFLNRADFVRSVSDYDEEKLTEYQDTKKKTAEKKAELEEEEEELEEVQEAQEAYKQQLNSQIASAKSKVSNFETELANAQAKAKEYQNTIKEQTALIQKLEQEQKRKEEEAKSTETGEMGGSAGAGGTGTGQSGTGGNDTPSPSKSPEPSEGGATGTGSGTGAAIANYAVRFVGNPYVSGGTSLTNGADCSGFTWAVHQHFGISIPRVSVDQAKGGKPVSIGSVQPGDILYYGNHVGIYIGNGQIVHASTQKSGIKISSYTYRTPICARRYW